MNGVASISVHDNEDGARASTSGVTPSTSGVTASTSGAKGTAANSASSGALFENPYKEYEAYVPSKFSTSQISNW